MFKSLREKFNTIIEKIYGVGRITKKDINSTIREIRTSFLEADVAIEVTKKFIYKIKKKAIGKKINKSFTPGQELINIIQKEMLLEFGEDPSLINISSKNPSIILVVGLQGMGKTTSTVKIANFIKKKNKKRVCVFSLDINRPAGIEQLKLLSNMSNIDFLDIENKTNHIKILEIGLKKAKKKLYECILIDTAGRLHVNKHMMEDLKNIQRFSNPIETLLVCDAMIGQDSIKIIESFNNNINLTGIVLTKTDSDARCGIALSAKSITKQPIKFLCFGEQIHQIEIFKPKKMVNRIIGMDDITSFIEKINNKINKKNLSLSRNYLRRKNRFNLNNFLNQIDKLDKIGGVDKIIERIPEQYVLKNQTISSLNNSLVKNFKTIIQSMTHKERNNPKIIKGSRKKRIALGSGCTIQQVNILLQKFYHVKKIMNRMKKDGTKSFFKNLFNKKIF
ncbi:signal recognition particle receptor subunit alpha [Buchnera aphidicola (Chaitoregma tattakana)]|uniref:signal recognition particle receptor subunit alpha n=1 Tax=Buchnera aphidicola TaxID=9 RepID=UPI0031B86D22